MYQLKAVTATKKKVEAAKNVQEQEEKKALSGRKRKETSEQKITKMKAALDKEIEKAKAEE